MASLYLVSDFGGTNIRAALADGRGELLARVERPTLSDEGPEAVIERIIEALLEARSAAQAGAAIIGLGVAAPGPLNPYLGIVHQTPNLAGWRDVPLQTILEESLALPVRIGNDANLGALGEFEYGAGRDVDDLVYLTISTGIGGGVVSQGQLIQGAEGLGAEVGHMVLEPYGPWCGCGKRGCLEALAAGPHMARRAQERVALGAPSSLAPLGEAITAKDVAAHARSGDPVAREVWERAAFYIGLGITNLAHLFNCHLFVLGGGVSREGDFLYEPVRRTVAERTLRPFLPITVTAPALGLDVGLYGALAYARLLLEKGDTPAERP